MPTTPIWEKPLPVSKDCRAARKYRSQVRQVLILAAVAFVWLCGSPGLVGEAQAGGGGLGGANVTYAYDGLGRLVAVVDGSGNWASYQYDAVGNVISIRTGTSSTVEMFSISPTTALWEPALKSMAMASAH